MSPYLKNVPNCFNQETLKLLIKYTNQEKSVFILVNQAIAIKMVTRLKCLHVYTFNYNLII